MVTDLPVYNVSMRGLNMQLTHRKELCIILME